MDGVKTPFSSILSSSSPSSSSSSNLSTHNQSSQPSSPHIPHSSSNSSSSSSSSPGRVVGKIGKGVMGLIFKPIVGGIDGIGDVIKGLHSMTSTSQHQQQQQQGSSITSNDYSIFDLQRPRRPLYGPNLAVGKFSLDDCLMMEVVRNIIKEKEEQESSTSPHLDPHSLSSMPSSSSSSMEIMRRGEGGMIRWWRLKNSLIVITSSRLIHLTQSSSSSDNQQYQLKKHLLWSDVIDIRVSATHEIMFLGESPQFRLRKERVLRSLERDEIELEIARMSLWDNEEEKKKKEEKDQKEGESKRYSSQSTNEESDEKVSSSWVQKRRRGVELMKKQLRPKNQEMERVYSLQFSHKTTSTKQEILSAIRRVWERPDIWNDEDD